MVERALGDLKRTGFRSKSARGVDRNDDDYFVDRKRGGQELAGVRIGKIFWK